MSSASFDPDWASPPGETIRDALAYRQLPSETLCGALGLTERSLDALLSGELEIDREIARGLSATLGGSQGFWLSRDANYRLRLSPQSTTKHAADFESFFRSLPLKEMKALGWLATPDVPSVLRFFEDAPGDWARSGFQMTEAVRFRTSIAHESNPVAVAAWLRQGVLQARALECERWNPAKLVDANADIRALTRLKAPRLFFPRLVDICRSCGVAVVFVRTPKGCRASGSTHFDRDRAIIQLSFRYRSDDHFWFTVFHEIGHLLLHPDTPLFVEGRDYEATQEEEEANSFAADTLVPPDEASALAAATRDFKSIMRLARKIGVSPGVVVGQMQNRKLIRHDQFNFLKVRYDWETLDSLSP